jgi:phage shock protein E
MLNRIKVILIGMAFLALATSSCNLFLSQTEPGSAPTQIIEPASTQSGENLPQSDGEIPRVTIEETRAAFDSSEAIILDVRPAGEYNKSHIPGAINIPLEELEANPTVPEVDKAQWIITYCT